MASKLLTSVKVDRQPNVGTPYLQKEDVGGEGRMFAGLLSPGRYVKPSECTAASWVVTVPSGSVFLLAQADGLVRVELTAEETVTGDATDNDISLSLGVDANGGVKVLLRATADVPSGALALGVVNNNTFTVSSTLGKKNLKTQMYVVPIPAIDASASQFVVVGSSGNISKVSLVANGQPSATITATLKIATVSVTNGAPALLSTDVLGTVKTATPSAANAIAAGAAIEVSFNHNANTTAGTGCVLIEVTE